MISIIEHIQYLIVNQECVVIPGLGAFVSRHVPASLNDDGSVMTPPSRELGFNSSLTHDDGMLIGSITRREGISYECARNAVEQEVELILRRLRHEGTIDLPRIGSLSLVSYGAIEFTPATDNPLVALPFCGLPLIQLLPETASGYNQEEEEPVILEVDMAEEPRRRSNFAIAALKYAASAALLVGVCMTLLTPISPKNVDFASLQPVMKSETSAEFMPEESKYAGRKIFISRPDPREATAEITRTADKYYVIVASATSMKEARRYVRMHSTAKYPLQILQRDGRFRVYAASGNDFGAMSDFRKADAAFAAANPNAWIYSMR